MEQVAAAGVEYELDTVAAALDRPPPDYRLCLGLCYAARAKGICAAISDNIGRGDHSIAARLTAAIFKG